MDARPQGFIVLGGGALALIFAIMACAQKRMDAGRGGVLVLSGAAVAGGAGWFFADFKNAISEAAGSGGSSPDGSKMASDLMGALVSVGMGVYLCIAVGGALLVIGFMSMGKSSR